MWGCMRQGFVIACHVDIHALPLQQQLLDAVQVSPHTVPLCVHSAGLHTTCYVRYPYVCRHTKQSEEVQS